MNIVEIIERKKQGRELQDHEIDDLVQQFTAGDLPDYQMSAFLMAVWFQGMTAAETVALTAAMLHSGSELDLQDLDGPTADKHSTGGVGDKVSLLLAPLAAACGLKVPMLSGRGLGHTGGTLDKLEAIPGYQVHCSNEQFLATVAEVGCAIVGQSADIAPADGKIYALRDVTATIDCVPLITASILSKKLAAGPETIIIDLKTGSGAFMSDQEAARGLARALVDTAANWGRRLAVLFSDMSQPLGTAVGHATETIEAFRALRPGGRQQGPADLIELTEALVTEMVWVSGLRPDRQQAEVLVQETWDSGDAFDRMLSWVAAQGGRIVPEREDFGLVVAPVAMEVTTLKAGVVATVACRQIGYALADLGGARRRVEESVDLGVGIDFLVRVGQEVAVGEPLAVLYCQDRERAERAAYRIREAVAVGEGEVAEPALILGRLGPES
ncbi:MAG: thymidine phosphorylase [bacterium]